jgi:recombination-promoting nuclease RpnE
LPKPLLLVDLGQLSEAELKQHGTIDLLELLLRQSQERTCLEWLKANPTAVVGMVDDLVEIYGTSSIIFILEVERKHSPEEVIEAIVNIVPHKKEAIMTAAQQLHQQGMQQGMQQGRQEGMQAEKLHIAKNLLSNFHLDMKIVSEATGLSEQELMRLQEKSSK